MDSPSYPFAAVERLCVTRLGSTRELCAAIEAAQYARLFVCDEPATAGIADAVEAFIDSFGAATEGWDAAHGGNKAPFLDILRARLDALAAVGMFVHHACIERRMVLGSGDTVVLPVAVIAIHADPSPTRTISLPAHLSLNANIGADDD